MNDKIDTGIKGVRGEIASSAKNSRLENKADNQAARLETIKWMAGIDIAIASSIVAAIELL